VSVAVVRRVLWEQRVRLPLLWLFALVWGVLIVTVYDITPVPQRQLGPEQIQSALRIFNIDPLSAWVGVGQSHPLFLAAAGVFLVGGAVRAIAGELEAGTLELTLARPLSRSRYLLSYVAVLVPGALVFAAAYAGGALVSFDLLSPSPGHLALEPMLKMAGLTALLLLAIAGYSLLCSALAADRGRALSFALGITIAMYAWSFLAPLAAALKPFARISLWWWYSPSRVLEGGSFPLGDALVLALVAVSTTTAALVVFLRRDLA
jgi:ABC-2 type transport system permease protein